MAKPIVWSRRAINDRKDILGYWKGRNKSSAYGRKLNAHFKKAVQLIATHPNIGRRTDIEGIRVKLVRPNQIFYNNAKEQIEILIIWDGRRNPDDLKKLLGTD